MPKYQIASKSTPGKVYTVTQNDLTGLWYCPCTGYEINGNCRHVKLARAGGRQDGKAVNERRYRLSGSVYAEEDLVLGQDVDLLINGTVVKVAESDNSDGTLDRVYTIKPVAINDQNTINRPGKRQL